MDKTLFVSDLDGTLLLPDETLSRYTKDTLNYLTQEKDLFFSYASARSFVTASQVTKGLSFNIPAIIYNGAFIYHNEKRLTSNFFSQDDVKFIKNLAELHDVFPLVYSFTQEKERYAYYTHYHSKGQDEFVKTRNDFRSTSVNTAEALFLGNVFYFTFIGNPLKLTELYPLVKDKYTCYFQNDIYSGEKWLEIMPRKTTKAMAALKLKELLNCQKLVVFGDGINDISMFKIADECYAVENANPKLKEIATAVIDTNTKDGVAKFLKNLF